jgi:type II secretory pathway component PulK
MINLNHAPPRVLQAILGVDGDTARKIRSALPAQEGAGGAQRWLASPSDLVSRGLISPAAFAALPKRFVTVYSVADHAQPLGFLNLNAAAPEVLAAVLDIPVDAAKTAASKRPFRSLADVVAAAGKEPASFNYKPPPDAPDTLPKQLSLESRCFRIVSEAALSELRPDGVEIRATHRRVEAVVAFDPDGSPHVTFWSEAPERGEPEPV